MGDGARQSTYRSPRQHLEAKEYVGPASARHSPANSSCLDESTCPASATFLDSMPLVRHGLGSSVVLLQLDLQLVEVGLRPSNMQINNNILASDTAITYTTLLHFVHSRNNEHYAVLGGFAAHI